jgi:hypothetical protein
MEDAHAHVVPPPPPNEFPMDFLGGHVVTTPFCHLSLRNAPQHGDNGAMTKCPPWKPC